MTFNDTRDSAHTDAFDAARQLDHYNVKIPTAVSEALAALRTHIARDPGTDTGISIRALYAAAAPDTDIDAALINQVTHKDRRAAWHQARADLGTNALHTIRAHGDELHTALAKLADELIESITAAAQLDAPLDRLIRDARTDAADLLARAEANTSELSRLYQFRTDYLWHPRADHTHKGWDAQRWRKPDIVDGHERGTTTWESWRNGIRNGGQLWYPTHAEAHKAAIDASQRYAAAHPTTT